jgi:dolichol-phosphate mannosyltransferase
LKYALVGVSGTFIDIGLFALLLARTVLSPTIAATLSFILAVINNYTWNRLWTYAHVPKKNVHKQFAKFFFVSCGGLVLNILFLHLFSFGLSHVFFPLPIWGSVLAKIGASGMVLVYNFLLNTFWTFSS